MKYPKYLEKGMKFNRGTVIEVDKYSKFKKVWPSKWAYICKCECGKTTPSCKNDLTSGNTKSCGCIRIKGNEVKEEKNHIKIFLSNSNKFTLIDKEDYEKVKDCTWCLNDNGYAVTYINKKQTRLHRFIMDCPEDKYIDHKHHDKLDNRKENLRIVTRSQNLMNHKIQKNNTSGYSGVYWIKTMKKWKAGLAANKQWVHLGYFKNKKDAIKVRKEAEIKYLFIILAIGLNQKRIFAIKPPRCLETNIFPSPCK